VWIVNTAIVSRNISDVSDSIVRFILRLSSYPTSDTVVVARSVLPTFVIKKNRFNQKISTFNETFLSRNNNNKEYLHSPDKCQPTSGLCEAQKQKSSFCCCSVQFSSQSQPDRVLGRMRVKFCPFPLTLMVALTTLSHYRVSVWYGASTIFGSRRWPFAVRWRHRSRDIRLPIWSFLYRWSMVTMRLSCIVSEIYRVKDNGVTTLTFFGHVTSLVTWPLDSAYVVFYWWSIVSICLYGPLWRYGASKIIGVTTLTFGVTWRLRSRDHSTPLWGFL